VLVALVAFKLWSAHRVAVASGDTTAARTVEA
jgi:hypothetical protein